MRSITVSMPPELIELVKDVAWSERKSTSALVCELVKAYVETTKKGETV